MYIDKNLRRFNILAPVTFEDEVHTNLLARPDIMERMGIVEHPTPQPPADFDPELYFVNEIDEAPYIVYTKKPQEMINILMARKYEQALDNHLDKVAFSFGGWSSRHNLIARAGYPSPYQELAIAFGTWMDQINWDNYLFLQRCMADPELMPASVEAFIASLPIFEFPATLPTP